MTEHSSTEDTSNLAPTDMLYMTYEGNQLTECSATVLKVEKDGTAATVYLDRTVMHAQGGGQPTDKGTLSSVGATLEVSKIVLDRETGLATHTGTFTGEPFQPGDEVKVAIDKDLRRILSECHTGTLR
jgi:Ser-tRNA(Ala) deacylase AlaX